MNSDSVLLYTGTGTRCSFAVFFSACEENFNGYFRKNGAPTTLESRYGINAAGFGDLWHKRFRVDEEPNEPNRFGWVTEINPFEP